MVWKICNSRCFAALPDSKGCGNVVKYTKASCTQRREKDGVKFETVRLFRIF